MGHRPLFGHRELRSRLASAWQSRRLPSSLLLQGPRGVGKQRLALWLGELILCERTLPDGLDAPCGRCQACRYSERGVHPDLHWFFPRPRLKDSDPSPGDVAEDLAEAVEDRMKRDGLWSASSGTEGLQVAMVRALVHQASLRPAMSSHAVFVVGDAERMVPQEGQEFAANAFLKLLEEPSPSTTIIITSSEPGALLPTVRSRVVTIRVPLLGGADVEAFLDDPSVEKRLSGLSRADAIARAGGAPGELLTGEANAAAFSAARRLLDAALQPPTPGGSAERIKAAARQGIAGARGAFTDTLDAMVVLLHGRVSELVALGLNAEARRTAAAMSLLDVVKVRAHGNVSPQLLGAALVQDLHEALRQ
ncbi:MAG: hypothetical protein ABIW79_07765 [Gemmatimonas sp.]